LKTKSEEEETEAAGYEGMEAFARAIEIGLYSGVQNKKVNFIFVLNLSCVVWLNTVPLKVATLE